MLSKDQKNKIYKILREKALYLQVLEDKILYELISTSKQQFIEAGEKILSLGQSVEDATIILRGSAALIVTRDWGEDRVLEQIETGILLAESELLNGEKSRCDIRTLEPTTLLVIPRGIFIHHITKHVKLWQYLLEQGRSKVSSLMVTEYISNLFGTAQLNIKDPLLRLQSEEEWLNFESEILVKIQNTAEWVRLKRGEFLFHQGDLADGAYIIVSGMLKVTLENKDKTQLEISRLGQGEIVGELALITNENRSASIEAIRECELFSLPSDLITQVVEKYPRIMLNIYRIISKRFRSSITTKIYRPKKSNIAILTIDNEHNDKNELNNFINQLNNKISAIDSTTFLNSHEVDKQLGFKGISNINRHDPSSIGLMQWLNNKELQSRYIVYRADDGWSSWTSRCIHQADTIILVVMANHMPDFTEIKKHLNASKQQWTLLMLHNAQTERPRNSNQWLSKSNAKAIYHVRLNNVEDINRVARLLTGKAISLVLGGGGAKGFAHIGVLRALEEKGIKIDMIGGSSIGAPIGGWIAQGKSSSQCQQLAHQAFNNLLDITLPSTSIIQGKRISSVICKQTASWDIEDFWIPFFCISSNITKACPMIHQRGNSAKAIRASISIPGVLPPVPENGDLLVDGGVLNNIPIDIMRKLNPSGTILAVDVVPPTGPQAIDDYGLSLSGWKQLLWRLIPWKKPQQVQTIGTIIIQSMMLGSDLLREQVLQQKLSDFYQNIPVDEVGMLEFTAIDKGVEIGYKTYIEPLNEWLQTKKN